MLIDDLIDDHFKVLAGGGSFFFDGLYLFSHFVYFIVAFSYFNEFSLATILELIVHEQKFAVVEIAFLLHLDVHHFGLVFFTH